MRFLRNQSLKKYTSFRIGGAADHFCVPASPADLQEALAFARARNLRVAVLGAGTNTLVLDRGFRGLVIKLAGGLSWVRVKGRRAHVGAGVPLPRLIRSLAARGLSGMEFLAGIPGTVGGAIFMNAGAWGKEISGFVEEVKVMDEKGRVRTLKKRDLGFSYRKSKLQKKKWIICEARFKLRRQRKKSINKKIREFMARRREKQPLGSPSCGSVFRNPQGDFAGRLIEAAGLKGMRIGDAQVSFKHGNFILNLGDARAKDVIKLITAIRKKVRPRLEPEINILVEKKMY